MKAIAINGSRVLIDDKGVLLLVDTDSGDYASIDKDKAQSLMSRGYWEGAVDTGLINRAVNIVRESE